MMDDMSVRKVLMSIVPNLQRSYIVPELQANLLADKRKEALKKFSAPGFKKTATVIMGEPTQAFKESVSALILAEKQAKADVEEKKKKAEEARKAKEAARKKKDGKEEDAEAKEEEKKEPEDAKMEEAAEEPPVELTEEEKKLWFRKSEQPDLAEKALTASFARFSLPTKA